MLERSSFMRNSKYNIGGSLFSLFEVSPVQRAAMMHDGV